VACAPDQVCNAGMCRDICGVGLQLCDGQCVSLASDASHCGACNNVCPEGQVCEQGACTIGCEATICQTAAGSECVSLSEDPNHCGACNNACAEGYICVNAQCVLDCGALSECNGVCVDLLTDVANCGTCGTACPADETWTCTNGVCACSEGLELCGDACVDTSLDPENCGACGEACRVGDSCEAGSCVGPDGCSNTSVVGLSLSELAVYQAVKIPIMQDLTAIEGPQRNADVVQGRPAVFRVHVTPQAGWTPREVSARIELTNAQAPAADDSELFFSLLTPVGASSDDDPDSTFQVDVPAEFLTANTSYAVTLVECAPDPPSGTTQGARFPEDGFADLQAHETGPLRVHLIPLAIPGAAAPDLPDSWIEVYRNRVFAVYPVTEVEFSVGQTLSSSGASMCDHLAAITARRSADNAPVDLYYYGLTSDISGGQSGCSNAISNPSSSSKSSAGWAGGWAYEQNPESGAATMCHELGHAHGRLHAPCNVSDPDWNYPYPNADIGVWGHDLRSDEFLPPTSKDMMSYCPDDRTLAWLSDYTYQGLLERVAAVNALGWPSLPSSIQTTEPKVPWRLLVVDHLGPRWGEYPLLVRGTPEGTALTAIVHDRYGTRWQIEVYRQDIADGVSRDPYMLTVPEPEPGWYAIEVPGLLPPQVF
jgi:hypothetical protein